MAVYGYARVSTAMQADEGESLDVQQRQITGYVSMHGWTVDRVFVERGVSGSKPLAERLEGAALLAAAKPGDVIIAAKLDRVFRSALDALQMMDALREKGIRLHLIDLGGDVAGNGLSKLFLTIASAFAEAERDRIRERVAGVKADQRARGRYLGGAVPFGWQIGDHGELVEDPDQQKAIADIRTLRAAGKPLRTIKAELAARGHTVSLGTIANVVNRA